MIQRYNIKAGVEGCILGQEVDNGEYMLSENVLSHNAKVKEQLELALSNQGEREHIEKALELLKEVE